MLTDEQLQLSNYDQSVCSCHCYLKTTKFHFLNEIFLRNQKEKYKNHKKYWKTLHSCNMYYQGNICEFPLQRIAVSLEDDYMHIHKFELNSTIIDHLLKENKLLYYGKLAQNKSKFENINIKLFLGKTMFANMDCSGYGDISTTKAGHLLAVYMNNLRAFFEKEHADYDETLFYQRNMKYCERQLKKLRLSNQKEEKCHRKMNI